MKTYENVKCDVNVRIKIKKSRLYHVWLFGVDLTMCKLNKSQIIFVMQSNVASNTNTNTNSLFTQDYNVTSMRFIILHTYFTFTTTTKWRVDFRSKEKEKEKRKRKWKRRI